jgi:DNA-binding response OmpR family regulator
MVQDEKSPNETLTETITSLKTREIKGIEEPEAKSTLPLVLIVEDNADMRKYIRSCLDAALYKVIEARDGNEGLNKAFEKIPDLIISDVMMPQMDGNEMCSIIKTDERTSHIPVVLVTARASIEHKIKGIETGADAYIAKPFNARELQSWVKKLIEQRKKLRQNFMKNFGHGLNLKHQDITSVDQQFIKKAVATVEKYISDSEFSVEKFGQEMALSRVQLHRKLKALTDQSTSHFIRTIRLKNAANYLIKKGANVKETAYEFGFNNLSYFDKCFHKEFGMTPTDYVASHKS